MNICAEQGLSIPVLRFPKFSGEWESKKLGAVGEVKMCRRIFNEETSPIGEIPFYKIGSFGKEADAFIPKELYLEYREKFSFPKRGHILISAAGTIGRLVVYNGEDAYYQDSNIVWIDNDNSIVSNEFLFFILQIVKYNTEGGTIQRLYNSILKSTKFSCPSLPEQHKIAFFFTAVDQKIYQLKQKKTLLEQYKKGVMQKIFSQEIRFSDVNGQEFPKWQKKKIKDLVEIKYGKDQKQISCENGKYPILGTGGEMGRTNVFLTDKPSVLIGRKGTIDKPRYMDTPFWTVDTLFYTNIYSNTNPKWLYYKFETINWYLYNEASGVPSLSTSTIYSIPINLPTLPEQTKIANFLSTIDNKINHTHMQIEMAEVWKRGLLQRMFV